MMEVTQYETATYTYHNNYVRNYRAIGVLWAILTVCFAIINIVVFVQPQWLGDSQTSLGYGYFGLYQHCQIFDDGVMKCTGRFDNFETILHPAFRAAAFFVGFSALLILICICCFLLFFFMKASVVFFICAWIQVLSVICIFLGCVVFPAGWEHAKVKAMCGNDGNYDQGECEIRWAYILAIIGIFDVLFLCILAFVLATRQAKLLPEYYKTGTMSKSEMNGYHYDMESEKKSNMAINPVLVVPGHDPHSDRHSEYSYHSRHSEPRSKRDMAQHHGKRSDFAL